MRKMLLAALLILSTPGVWAQSRCEGVFSSANPLFRFGETTEVDLRKTKAYREAHQRYPGLRAVPEYAEATGTLVLHVGALSLDGYRYYLSLLKNLPLDVKTVMIGRPSDYETSVQYGYRQYARVDDQGKPLDVFLALENEAPVPGEQTVLSKWVQDHMGRMVKYDSAIGKKELVGMVSSGYRFNYRVSNGLAKFFGVQVLHHIAANHEWGNYTVMGRTAYLIDGPRIDASLGLDEFAYTGVDRLVILPQPKDKNGALLGIPHSDEFLMPLSDEVILTNVPEYQNYFTKQGKVSGLLPSNADLGLDYMTYTNAVLVQSPLKKVLFVPQFGGLSPEVKLGKSTLGSDGVKALQKRDQEALRAYAEIAEPMGITVVPVHIPEFTLNHFGGPHCATGICTKISNPDFMPSWTQGGARAL